LVEIVITLQYDVYFFVATEKCCCSQTQTTFMTQAFHMKLDFSDKDSREAARERSFKVIIFRVRRSWGKMYIGHDRLCMSVCLYSPHSHTTARTWM